MDLQLNLYTTIREAIVSLEVHEIGVPCNHIEQITHKPLEVAILALILVFKGRFLAQYAKILAVPPQILHQETKQVFRVKKLVGLPPQLELLARFHYAW